MNTKQNEVNYAALAGAYKGTMESLIYWLAAANIVDANKFDELKAYIRKEVDYIESTYKYRKL